MIEKIVSSGFHVDAIHPQNPRVISADIKFVNLNPQCGPWPFGDIKVEHNIDNQYACFESELSQDFIQAQILPRGRPHISLLHVALIDDAVASSSFTLITDEPYGTEYRYIETGAIVRFHQEAFFNGSIKGNLPRGTIEVDAYKIYWQCVKRKEHIPLLHRGLFRLTIIGVKDADELPIASVEGEYFRRRGVINTN